MLRFAHSLVMFLTFAPLGGCSDLGSASSSGCAEGEVRVGESCVPEPSDVETRTLTLGCTNNSNSIISIVNWELTVDPGPIIGGEAFGAILRGAMVFDEDFLDGAQTIVPGFKRVEVIESQATVHVREGAEPVGTRDVVLTHEPEPRTCIYDNDANTGAHAGPFPPCSQENDNPDGSNDDCTGFGGVPDPVNPCGEFITIPTSDDCDPDGLCDSKGKASQCAQFAFCVSDALSVPLESELAGYLAEGSGSVRFGWDDQSTGAELDDGKWILPPAVFEEPTGPNGLRVLVEGVLPAAFECTMGVGTPARFTPTPNSDLISFAIQSP